MTINLDTLRKTAEAATPGPWEARQGAVAPGKKVVGPRKPNDVGRGPVVLMQPIFWDERSAANADHIATFDPPTVLALLSRLEQAEQALDATERQVVARSGETAAERIWRVRAEQAEQAVQRVRELGDAWKSRGEHSMKYSETLQWPVAEAIHDGGADMVNNANLIYRALDGDGRG